MFLVILMIACSSGGKKIPDVADVTGESIWVSEGDNSQASYSSQGDRIVFISLRSGHRQPQVYFKVLETGEERRLTFQNGAVSSPHFHPNGKEIVYASNTDELKENPSFLSTEPSTSALPKSYQLGKEIYLHALSGLEIDRVTTRLGYDGLPRFSSDGNDLYWHRTRGDNTEVVVKRKSGSVMPIRNLGLNPTHYWVSNDRKFTAWLRWDEKFSSSVVVLKKNKEEAVELSGPTTVREELRISPDSRFLLWAQKNPKEQNFEIWIYDLESNCSRAVAMPAPGNRRGPVFSPDMKWLAYTLIKGGKSRIAAIPFTPPTGPCPATP